VLTYDPAASHFRTDVVQTTGGEGKTRGGKSEAPEGSTRSRVVVIEFPTYAAALNCYRSPEYSAAMALRKGKSIMDLAIVEGYEGPQPVDS
jgi:uncharacterized protein (DUF1330 family)